MKRKKRRNIIIWSVVALIVVIAGYFSFIRPQQQAKRTVTVGIMAGSKQDDEIWNSVSKTAKDKYNVTLKFKRFTDYNQPNKALENGDVDLNAFQHKLFLQTWNKAHKTDLVSLGDTCIAPIRLYSKQYKNVKEIPNGGTIAVPNDASNESRALFALKNAGLIDLKKGTKLATVSSISKNPRDLKIKELAADQTARSLDNVDAAVVNTNYAQAAGLNYKSAIFVEPVNRDSKQWVNIIAVKGSEKNNKIYKDVVRAYQTEKTKREIKKLYGTAEIPAWDLNFNK
ncbi:ABC transporter substrate-binding protein [Limosilactobacillus reuteri]|uniref:MetQ/NlpA family ABC transporter substrate-binding protein n=1 Tax=Limosilactobacillus reuteri TaxID=1598 RepID=UPI000D6EB308|nr:MetQ/NlpA family ABC transporter substrate-binding protein [Limosilactobacillus reuteri]PWT34844.1 ABC transporter substrate-binding protein [Limosilactobacillus reuteri]PWT54625.1 ABC transporter substrate-binding protein [Limosilactobacillus reuteri]PWT59278.1 ABC transporter substrate-binding protein [Limosilactobacillus reuteri]PWT63887.1 ABC transporter substrate-binding protein [Limosilactobacillus reuteri]PWT66054.1 ABC transporter substrate-binding protein [Limosilactobacillus reute